MDERTVNSCFKRMAENIFELKDSHEEIDHEFPGQKSTHYGKLFSNKVKKELEDLNKRLKV